MKRQDKELRALAREGLKHMTPEKWEEQRRSFAFGNVAIENDTITRESVNRVANKMAREKKQRRGTK